jgi:hypothetical protein
MKKRHYLLQTGLATALFTMSISSFALSCHDLNGSYQGTIPDKINHGSPKATVTIKSATNDSANADIKNVSFKIHWNDIDYVESEESIPLQCQDNLGMPTIHGQDNGSKLDLKMQNEHEVHFHFIDNDANINVEGNLEKAQ